MAETPKSTASTTSLRPSFAPDVTERALAAGSIILLVAILAAVARGHAQWSRIPAVVWLHLATIGVALVTTPILLLRPRGDRLHRQLGWTWVVSMFSTALISFGIRLSNAGALSAIHIFSAATLIVVPVIVFSARTHRISRHRRSVRIAVSGALLSAGFFTFPFNRMLGTWLFG
jgi:uncharacterized membrane protein